MADRLGLVLAVLVFLLITAVWNELKSALSLTVSARMNLVVILLAGILGLLAYAWMANERTTGY